MGSADTASTKVLEQDQIPAPKQLWGARHTQYILLFLLLTIAFGIRVSLSVAIVAMNTEDTSPNPDIPTYDWDDQSIVLSSFFWGYVVIQVLAGQLAAKYGPRFFLTAAMLVCSLAHILIPVVAENFGSKGTMVLRILQGFTQGFVVPSVHNLLSNWMPLPERSTVGTLVYAGMGLGNALSYPISGWISASWWGWPGVFYVYGGAGAAWALVFVVFGVNTPQQHKTIRAEERGYILKTLHQDEKEHHERRTPWKAIFTSMPFLAILVAHCGQNWAFWTLATETPTYMDTILKFDMKSNGLLTAAPYFTYFLLAFIVSPISQHLINRGLSVEFVRKLMHSIGVLIPGLALIALSFIDETNRDVAVGLLVVAVGFNSGILAGYNINHIDIAPNHAGTLMGITNSLSAVFSILGPLLVQFIVTEEGDLAQWRIVFCLGAAVYLVTDIFYVVFAKGEAQSWDAIEDKDEGGKDPV